MADLSIKLRTEADIKSFKESLKRLEAEIQPINIKANLKNVGGRSGSNSQGSVNLKSFKEELGPTTKKIENLKERLVLMNQEGSISKHTFDSLSTGVEGVQNKLNQGNITFENASKSLNKLEKSANGTKMGILGMSQPLGDVIGKFTTWYLIAGMVTAAIKGLKSIVGITIELDNAFSSIQMVTGYNKQQIKELRKEYIDLAQEMSVTVDEVTNGADEWLRAGLSVEETNDALRASLVLSAVAQMDSAEATKYLVAAMNGFNLKASELIGLVDKLSAVDVVAATSSKELGIALSYSATSAQLAGISLDKYIGMIATVSETTRQSAETIGNSFRSMFTRLQAVKIGSLDNSEEGPISDVDKVLSQYDIDLMKTTDNLRNMGNLLDVLGSKWKGFTEAQKSELATTIAGNYQRERFLVLMDNYDRALELSEVSMNSAGSAMDKYNIYQESVEANLKELKSAWVDFVNTLNTSGFIKWFIDLIKYSVQFISLINDGIDSLGALGTAIKIIIPILIAGASAWALFHSTMSAGVAAATIAISLTSVGVAIAGVVDQINGYVDKQDELQKETEDSEEQVNQYNEQLQILKHNLSDVNNALQEKINLTKKEHEELKKQEQIQSKLLAVEKARQALEEAKNKRIRIFRAGQGFVYDQDYAEVQKAQNSLDKNIKDLNDLQYDYALDRAEAFTKEFNDLITNGDIINGWDDLFDKFGDLLNSEFSSYIKDAEQFIKDFNSIVGDSGPQVSTNYKIGHNASGTRSWGGGPTWVGENGPEILNLPKNSEVLSHSKSVKLHDMVSNNSKFNRNGTILNFNGSLNFPNVRDENDASGFIKAIINIGNNSLPNIE